MPTPPRKPRRKSRRRGRKLLQRLDASSIDVTLVSALAGDVEPDESTRGTIARARRRRGAAFYSDVMFALSHRFFPAPQAKELWRRVVKHRDALEDVLGRPVGVTVAAADYLTNIRDMIDVPTLIDAHGIAEVADVALRDGLTGLLDHAAFESKLASEVQRYHRYADSFCLMMLDVDDFKAVNDERGHPFGDKVLAQVAHIIAGTARETDVTARYGGEEFVVLAPRTSVREAERLANRICDRVRRKFKQGCGVTVSIGVAGCPRDADDGAALIRAADRALYRAKGGGKDRVVLASRGRRL